MIRENGTMDVRVGDVIEQRRFSINANIEPSNNYMQRIQRYEPDLKDNEELYWTLDSDVPTIVQR